MSDANLEAKNGVQSKHPAYRRLTDDDLFRHSSQYRFWSFTADQLKQKRIELNARAVASVEENLRRFTVEQKDRLNAEDLRILEEKAIPVNADEEVRLVNFFAREKVQKLAEKLHLPTEIVATSITFFRRFFLENSVLEIEPKTIVFTTIFLACKSENYFIGIDSFASKTKSSKSDILKHEFRLLESLKFCLLNHHPYKALHGFFLDIQVVLHGKVDLKYMGQIYDRCKKKITNALLTDVVYLYSPPQITLAVLMLEDEALTTRYLELKFHGNMELVEKPGQDGNIPIDFNKMISLINSCKDIIENVHLLPVEEAVKEARMILAKVFYSQNPQALLNKSKRMASSESPERSPDKRPKI